MRYLAAIVLGWITLGSCAAELRYKAARLDNPLKGVIMDAYSNNDALPHSLEYLEMPLSDLISARNQFTWAALDQKLSRISEKGRQAVIRIYVDWPMRRSGLPQFLLAEGVRTNSLPRWRMDSNAGDIIPDYDDDKLRSALTEFIEAFGARYDARPEIGFIEAGLLGPWGEWLPWKDSGASAAVQREVVDAYQRSFRTTHVLFRFATDATANGRVGFHNDWFGGNGALPDADSNGDPADVSWASAPVGGRIFPELQNKLWSTTPKAKIDDAFIGNARSHHLSYLRLGTSFANAQAFGASAAVERLSRALGYELFVNSASVEPLDRTHLRVSVTMTNTGCAPFYYAWPVVLGIVTTGGVRELANPRWDIRTVLPGRPAVSFSEVINTSSLAPQVYKAALAIRNPIGNGSKVAFANEEQDASAPGFLTLGSITVRR